MSIPSGPHIVKKVSPDKLRGDEWLANMRKEVAEKRKVFGTSAFSATADTALDALPPQIGYSNSISAGGGGQTALEMLGGPEETLG